MSAIDHIEIDGRPIPLHVRVNAQARRIILRVHPKTSALIVTVPSKAQIEEALHYLWSQSGWLKKTYAALPDDCRFEADAVIPFRDVPHRVVHCPSARRGVWIDGNLSTEDVPRICVSGRIEHTRRRVQDWLKTEAKGALREKSDDYAGRLGLPETKLIIRDTHSRWGSCSSSGLLSFSWRLIMAPDFVLDYVVVHETAHRIHMNHGAGFWALVDEMATRRQEAEAWLKTEGPRLFLYK